MLHIKLFRLVSCLFRFNRNIETLCYGIEAKQLESKLVSKDTIGTTDTVHKIMTEVKHETQR
jgi:hypothetical protein